MDHDPTARETRAVGSGPHWLQNLICLGMAAKRLRYKSSKTVKKNTGLYGDMTLMDEADAS